VVVERRREGDEDTAPRTQPRGHSPEDTATYRISIDAEEGGFPIKDMRIPMCWIQYTVVPSLSRYAQGLCWAASASNALPRKQISKSGK
jgi:hypothetical protein